MEQLHQLINDMQTKFEKAEPIPDAEGSILFDAFE